LFPGTAVLAEHPSRTATLLVAGAEKREILGLLLEVDRDLPSPGLAVISKMGNKPGELFVFEIKGRIFAQ